MNKLYIVWNNKKQKKWLPVGELTYSDKYIFKYTRGAENEDFIAFGNMKDLDKVYISDELFPLFKNRLLSENRPEFNSLLEWLALDNESYEPIKVLGLTEGKRDTDSLEMFPCPEIVNGVYQVSFFTHGLRYIENMGEEALQKLKTTDPLYMCLDMQNEYDSDAVLLRTQDPVSFVGYCPRYLTKDFVELLKENASNIKIEVKKVNLEAPTAYRLLCTLTAKDIPSHFSACSDSMFTPLSYQ